MFLLFSVELKLIDDKPELVLLKLASILYVQKKYPAGMPL